MRRSTSLLLALLLSLVVVGNPYPAHAAQSDEVTIAAGAPVTTPSRGLANVGLGTLEGAYNADCSSCTARVRGWNRGSFRYGFNYTLDGNGTPLVAGAAEATFPVPAGTRSVMRPRTSNLNFVAGQDASNLVISPLGAGGLVHIRNMSASPAQVVVDLTEWFSGGSGFTGPGDLHTISPTRFFDTRVQAVPFRGPGCQYLQFAALAEAGAPVPMGATSLVNLTITNATGSGYAFATNYPALYADEHPGISHVNFAPGETNAALVTLGPVKGMVGLCNHGASADIVADIVGWFTPSTDGLHSASPAQVWPGAFRYAEPWAPGKRLLDTRVTAPAPLVPGTVTNVAHPLPMEVGAVTPAAVFYTVVGTGSLTPGHVRAWPKGGTATTSSVLNLRAGRDVANSAIVGVSGTTTFTNTAGTTHLVVDAQGFFRR